MKKIKLFAFITMLFASVFMLFAFNRTSAQTPISNDAIVSIDAEMNKTKTIVRFIVTSKGVELKEIEEIELILKKDNISTKKQLFITTVYTSISNASKEYLEEENTYYGILNITDTKLLSGSTINANIKITFSDESIKTLDEDKIFNIPSIPTYNQDDNYIYFGSYPQTMETDDEITSSLNELVGNPTNPVEGYNWIDYGYYISNVKTEYMYYIDIDTNNDTTYDYRGVYSTQYRPMAVDKPSSKAESNVDEYGFVLNTTYWFKYEPIKWDVLDIKNGKAIITTNQAIDSQNYLCAAGLPSATPSTHNGLDNRYLNAYDASDIRIWLNDTFYNTAFDNVDKKIIEKTLVDNGYSTIGSVQQEYLSDHPEIDQDALLGENTYDYIYLLSYDDYQTYYEDSDSRRLSPTDYAKSQGFGNPKDPSGDYFTRTPAYTLTEVSYVTRSGNLDTSGTNYTNYKKAVTFVEGIRPTMLIDLDKVQLNVSSNNIEIGNTNIEGTSIRGYTEKIDLVATPIDGYSFDGWYNGDVLLSEDKEFTYIMPNQDANIVAKFSSYTLTTSIDNEAAGQIEIYDHEMISAGDSITLEIYLNGEYSFFGWYNGDELLSTNIRYTFDMPKENLNIVAKTTEYTLTVNSYLANGFEDAHKITFETNGAGIINPQYSNNLIYPYLTKDGYIFAGWYDNPEFDGETFDFKSNITKDIKLYARWIEKDGTSEYINYSKDNRSVINSNGADFSDYCKIIAFVDGPIDIYTSYGYQYDNATIEIYDANMELLCEPYIVYDYDWYVKKTFDAHAGDLFYIRFKPVRLWYGYKSHSLYTYYSQDTSANGYEYGEVDSYNNEVIRSGRLITLQATNFIGTTFMGWYKGDELLSTNIRYTFNMPKENLEIYAKFEYFTVTLINDNEDAGEITDYNETKIIAEIYVTIEAKINPGYAFLGWYDQDDNLISKDHIYKFSMPYENLVYTAKYASVSIELNKNIEEAGDLSVSPNLEYGRTGLITAAVNYGYTFVGWYDSNDNKLTDELSYGFTVEGNHSFTAKYIVNNISISTTLDEAGTLSDFEFGYLLNQELEVTYTINDGYTWYGWFLNDEFLTLDKTITIIMNEDVKSYVAKVQKYVLTIKSNIEEALIDYATITYDSKGGSAVAPQKSYEIKYIIPTKQDYVFAGWYINEECEGEAYQFDTIIEGDITLYAKWIESGHTAFPFNERRYTWLPNGSNNPASWYAFYPLVSGDARFEIENIVAYGYKVSLYAADKTTLIFIDESPNARFYDKTFSVEANTLYYLVLRQYYINDYDVSHYMTLTIDIPGVSNKTARNNDIIAENDTVYLYAEAKEGYTFVGWYLEDELVTTNKYYSFIMNNESITYQARYSRNSVSYTVNHYIQNVDDNEYTLVTKDVEILNGLTGEYTNAIAKEYVGFESLEFEQKLINGDNSTIINIYYDRISYQLDLDITNITNDTTPGSININSNSFRFEKEITLIARANSGYNFVGWYNGEQLLSTDNEYTFNMPNKNIQYTAKFESLIVEYNVKYWIENIYDDGYTEDKTITLSGYTGNDTEAEVLSYDICNTPTVTQQKIAGDESTIINIYYKRKTISKVGIEIFFGLYNDKKFGYVVRPEGFTSLSTGSVYEPHRYYCYMDNVKVGYEITPLLSLGNGYSLEGWYLNNDTRIEGSELEGFTFTYTLDNVTYDIQEDSSNGVIWLVARLYSDYVVRYNYQNNVNEWIAGAERRYTTAESYIFNNGILLELSDVDEDSLSNIRDGFEVFEIENALIKDNKTIIDIYFTPKQYVLNIERVYAGNYVYYGDDYAGDPNTDILLYYGQTSKLLKAEDSEEEDITYLGWYFEEDGDLVGDAITKDFEYSFEMPSKNIMLVPVFSIKYELRIVKDGITTTEERIGNIGFRVDVDEYEGYYVSSVRYYSREITDYAYSYLRDDSPIVIVEYKHLSD